MKKDIDFLTAENVLLAIVNEESDSWNVYLINKNSKALSNVMVTSKGYGTLNNEEKSTSTLRHMFDNVAPNEYIVIEPIQEELFKLTNEFFVTYYIDGKIYDKKFIYVVGSLESKNVQPIKELGKSGVLHS